MSLGVPMKWLHAEMSPRILNAIRSARKLTSASRVSVHEGWLYPDNLPRSCAHSVAGLDDADDLPPNPPRWRFQAWPDRVPGHTGGEAP